MTVELIVAVIAVAAAASWIQAVAGSGFGVIAGPLLMTLQPELMPGILLLVSPPVFAIALWQDRLGLRSLDLVLPSLLGVVGALAALPLLPRLDVFWLSLAVGATVTAAASAALAGLRVPQRQWVLALAGTMGGALSTLAAAPGPPLLVVYNRSEPQRYRANLSLFFLVACTVSLVVLVLAGRLEAPSALGALWLVPGIAIGMIAAAPLRGRLPGTAVRKAGLWIALLAGALLLTRTVL
ncbi:TSUP family transporter [Kocuria coralli]|uniref:TSUP family transporter n=1 Tax=Kocuria coralli TaxID=1461025 RepID=UPI0015F2D7A5|nr:TSUP family transporter [Kocuria coralli]